MTIEETFLELGKRLMKIRDEELYKPQWDSFHEYVGEVKMSESSASKLISIYEKFILKYQIDPERVLNAGGWSTVAEVLPMVKNKDDAEHWLSLGETLSRKDLRSEIEEKKRGVQQHECKHRDTYDIRICKDCGARIRLYEDIIKG